MLDYTKSDLFCLVERVHLIILAYIIIASYFLLPMQSATSNSRLLLIIENISIGSQQFIDLAGKKEDPLLLIK